MASFTGKEWALAKPDDPSTVKIDAWYMDDDTTTDQREEHRQTPNRRASPEALHELGVLYWGMDADAYETDERLAAIRKIRNYSWMQIIAISKDTLPEYEAKLKTFYEEHIHDDEEIRMIMDGSGFFDVRDKADQWIRIHCKKGDLIVLPEGIYHRGLGARAGSHACMHAPPHARHAPHAGGTTMGQLGDHETLEAEFYDRQLQASAVLLRPVVRRCYGGPAPFGLGMGVVKPLEAAAWLRPLPDPRADAREQRKRRRMQLLQLTRSFGAPLDGLSEEEREQVLRGRLKFLLSKFWGLMNEADRPWHFDAVMHLTCRLPKPSRLMYRRVKPSTMQRLLARRERVERAVVGACEDAHKEQRWINRWQAQVLEQGRIISRVQLGDADNRMLNSAEELGKAREALQELRSQARKLKDTDYDAYGAGVEALASDVAKGLRALRRHRLRFIADASGVNATFMSYGGGGGITLLALPGALGAATYAEAVQHLHGGASNYISASADTTDAIRALSAAVDDLRGLVQAQQIASLVDLVRLLLMSRVPGAPMHTPHAVPHAAHSAPRAAPAAKAAQPARPAAAAAPVASAAGAPAAERPAAAGAARAASARGPCRRGGLPARVGDASLRLSFVASISVEDAIVFVTGGDGCGHANDVFSGCFADDAEEARRRAADAAAGVSMPVRLATNIVRFMHDNTGNWDGPAGGGVVSASFINAKPAVGGIGVEPRGGGVLRVLFTVASGAVADTVVRWRWKLRQTQVAVFDVLSDREEARHRALWPAFLAAKAAGKRAQFHRARLVVDGERVAAPVC
ncbi:hypothetical protein FOA52_003546 [Chlamydomonas sp. UWO 241]|nr:hypothetical protein FOA52_003546 [Chlamydomonas sp. UWO 241]